MIVQYHIQERDNGIETRVLRVERERALELIAYSRLLLSYIIGIGDRQHRHAYPMWNLHSCADLWESQQLFGAGRLGESEGKSRFGVIWRPRSWLAVYVRKGALFCGVKSCLLQAKL